MKFQELQVSSQRVLIRVDFNVPLNDTFDVTDDTRIVNALPTIQHFIAKGAKVILLSHLGRPLKKLDENGHIQRNKFTLNHLISPLSSRLGQDVKFHSDCVGPSAVEATHQLENGEVLLMENTRFHEGETKGSEEMAEQLSLLGDIYINDAFGTAHRAHASTAVIARYFEKERKAFGALMERELENGAKILSNPEAPVVAVLGGAKVSDKIQLVKNLMALADDICIGGGMAYTFKKALGGEIGKSLCEEDKLELALDILEEAKINNCRIHLPTDSRCATAFAASAEGVVMPSDSIAENYMGLDIGPSAVLRFSEVISNAKTILWNGPMGVFEFENFAEGTLSIAKSVAEATESGAYSLVGGGDSVSAIKKTGLAHKISFISTGGGAMLELLEGKTLPGVAAMKA